MQKTLLLLFLSALVLSACQESLADRSVREAREYTLKKCPAKLSESTVIDSLVFDKKSLTMHYYFTISGRSDSAELIKEKDPREELIKAIKNNTPLRKSKDAGFNFAFTYRSTKHPGKVLYTTVITPDDYQ